VLYQLLSIANVSCLANLYYLAIILLRAKAGTAIADLSHRNSVRPSVCLSVCHGWISQKLCKLGGFIFWRFWAATKSVSFTRRCHGTIIMCTSAWL